MNDIFSKSGRHVFNVLKFKDWNQHWSRLEDFIFSSKVIISVFVLEFDFSTLSALNF